MAERVTRSAVAVIETTESFVLQRRPDLPGKLAYPGMLQFFGGHVEKHEEKQDEAVVVARELEEEATINLSPEAFTEHWRGEFEGTGKQGEPVLRHVAVYHLGLTALGRETMVLKEAGEIVDIPKNREGLEASARELTPFAYKTLKGIITERESQDASA
ncbi:MAG TPA: NUDIX domain-containing protein [Candidatus Saccharimonadales bacterium]|nr:NUDIX domain-containing protein [Candidatus Saccharimonadales bacterium]